MNKGADSRVRQLLLCAAVMVVVVAVGFGFDVLLLDKGVPRLDIMLLSNVLTGVVAGVFYYSISNYERESRQRVRQQLHIIAEMNHHIRNALQVITYVAGSNREEESVHLIRSSVERIERALREVLPGDVVEPQGVRQEASSITGD